MDTGTDLTVTGSTWLQPLPGPLVFAGQEGRSMRTDQAALGECRVQPGLPFQDCLGVWSGCMA